MSQPTSDSIPAEIEAADEASVKSAAARLGFEMEEALYGSVDQVYKVYYDVTSHDINYCPEIKFTDIPNWLDAKRRLIPCTSHSVR